MEWDFGSDEKDQPFKPRITMKVNGVVCDKGIEYLGRATLMKSGAWRACALIPDRGFCVVEFRLKRESCQ